MCLVFSLRRCENFNFVTKQTIVQLCLCQQLQMMLVLDVLILRREELNLSQSKLTLEVFIIKIDTEWVKFDIVKIGTRWVKFDCVKIDTRWVKFDTVKIDT